MKKTYFNLNKKIQVKQFEEFERPMGWFRLTEENIEQRKAKLTDREIKFLRSKLK